MKSKLATFQKTLAQGKEQLVNERESLKKKEEALAEQAQELKREKDKLAGRAESLAEESEKIAKRKENLTKAKDSLHERSQKIQDEEERIASSSAQYAGLNKERQMLVEVKKFLEVSESEMIRKWSTSKATSLVVSIVIATIMLASFSYAIGHKVIEPTWQGDMAIQITLPEGEEAPSPDAWINASRQTISNESVLKESLAQLEQRGVRVFNSTNMLAQHLDKNLTVDGKPGRMELTYTNPDKELCVPVLEALGRAVVGHQLAQDRLNNRKDTVQIARAATRSTEPVHDDRLKISAVIFGGLLTACMFLWIVMRIWLRRTQSMFGVDNGTDMSILESPSGWSTSSDNNEE